MLIAAGVNPASWTASKTVVASRLRCAWLMSKIESRIERRAPTARIA
jgi:hypothetical protein